MGKCPFCGAEKGGVMLKCGSVYQEPTEWNSGIWKLGWNRTAKCYETEITRLKALVREMGELLRYRSDGAAHKVLTNPEVRAIMEEENESIMIYDNSDSKPEEDD